CAEGQRSVSGHLQKITAWEAFFRHPSLASVVPAFMVLIEQLHRVGGAANTHRYSITSSARASTDAGMSRPSALSVFRLITISYLVGACTGSSAGFSPLRMGAT